MQPFWIEFADRKPACIEAASEKAVREIAAAHGAVLKVHVLPYPREPRLGERSDCPSLCYGGRECLGVTACPKNYACSE